MVELLFRIDVGFDENRGYACVVYNVKGERSKGIKGNSMEQLTSRLRNVLNEEMSKRRTFPLESEPSRIIVPNGS